MYSRLQRRAHDPLFSASHFGRQAAPVLSPQTDWRQFPRFSRLRLLRWVAWPPPALRIFFCDALRAAFSPGQSTRPVWRGRDHRSRTAPPNGRRTAQRRLDATEARGAGGVAQRSRLRPALAPLPAGAALCADHEKRISAHAPKRDR